MPQPDNQPAPADVLFWRRLLHPPRGEWTAALCRAPEHAPADWFSERDEIATRRAKQICRVCPLQLPCLTRAVECRTVDGVWGGVNFFDDRERKRARRALGDLVRAQARRCSS